ncbi:MAG: hypothetical protein V4537_13870 [Pseudomonadota bacterium]
MQKRTGLALIVAATVGGIALASETISYRYDARGRLVSVQHTGSVNDGVVTNYALDNAHNRTTKTVTGAP